MWTWLVSAGGLGVSAPVVCRVGRGGARTNEAERVDVVAQLGEDDAGDHEPRHVHRRQQAQLRVAQAERRLRTDAPTASGGLFPAPAISGFAVHRCAGRSRHKLDRLLEAASPGLDPLD